MLFPFHRGSKWNDGSNGGLPRNWRKSIIIFFSLFLGESSTHESCLVFFNTLIHNILNILYPFGGHCWLPFRYWHNFPHIVLHDWLVLFIHFLLPHFLTSFFFIRVRFFINDFCHERCIARVPFKFLYLSRCAIKGCMSLFLFNVDLIHVGLFFISRTMTSFVGSSCPSSIIVHFI